MGTLWFWIVAAMIATYVVLDGFDLGAGAIYLIAFVSFGVQAEGLIEGGADILILETVNDTLNCKAGLVAIEAAIAKLGVAPAIAVSGTIETAPPVPIS